MKNTDNHTSVCHAYEDSVLPLVWTGKHRLYRNMNRRPATDTYVLYEEKQRHICTVCGGTEAHVYCMWRNRGTCVLYVEKHRHMCTVCGEIEAHKYCMWRNKGTCVLYVLYVEKQRPMCTVCTVCGEIEAHVYCMWRNKGTCVRMCLCFSTLTLCMYACAYTITVYTVHEQTQRYTYALTHKDIYSTYICTHTRHTYVLMYAWTHTCMYIFMYSHTRVHAHTGAHTERDQCIHTYTCAYTNIHMDRLT